MSLNIKNRQEWASYCKNNNNPLNIPSAPQSVYEDKWEGWKVWLGTDFWSYERSREFVRRLSFKNGREWREYAHSNKRLPNIPSAPDQFHGEKWKCIKDWLGVM